MLLDCGFELKGADSHSFNSSVSVFDYDIVIWDPHASLNGYELNPYGSLYKGRPRLSEAGSVRYVTDILRRKKEFMEFLALGRTLAVFLPGTSSAYYDTGRREYFRYGTQSTDNPNHRRDGYIEGLTLLCREDASYRRGVAGCR